MTDAVLEHCRDAIRGGSKSFFAAARIFDRPTRESAYLLYAWCRHCDDQVDMQDLGQGGPRQVDGSAQRRLESLERQTRQVLAGTAPGHPAFAGLQRVVARHAIDQRYPLELLEGFRMDVEGRRYESLDDVLAYCYHVAGVVGLMMGRIMGVEDEPTLDRAADLGLAFQMTNIARDVLDDARAGRVYLPLAWLGEAGVAPDAVDSEQHRAARFSVVARLLAAAEPYYDSSLIGIARLRFRHAWAIAAARRVYREIGRRVLERGASAWDERTVVGTSRKLQLLLGAAVQALVRRRRPASPRRNLWQRPSG